MRKKMIRYAGTVLAAFAIATSTAAESLTVDYAVSIPRPQTHLFHIEVRVHGLDQSELALSMPVWSTGYYQVLDFAGGVTQFDAVDAAGDRLEWKKLDKNTWSISTRGIEALVARYKVYRREAHIIRSFLNARSGHILGSSLFMFIDGRTDLPASLRLDLPAGWKVSNGAIPSEEDPNRFEFDSYHELIDTPMVVGTHRDYTYEVDGIPHVVAIDGGTDMDRDAFVEGTQKLVQAASGLFGGLPYKKYCFILFLAPGMVGGLEHANGTSMGSSPWGFSRDPKRLERLLHLTSHEYFHTWNVKNIQPHVFKPYDYDQETETGFLWFSEGVTSYYTDQLLLRAGMATPESVLRSLAELIGRTRNTPGRLYKSAFDASFDTWIVPWVHESRVNTYFSYYTKGEIAGLIIDLEIIKRTNAEKSFDDVLLDMWEAYQERDAGFDTEAVRKLCEKVAGGSFQEIFADYIYGVKEVPFEDYLKIAGYQLTIDEHRTKEEQKGAYLGARYREGEGSVRITEVLRDTEAWLGGLNYDDEIIAFDGVRIQSSKDLDLQLELKKPGDEAKFIVGRAGRVEELTVAMEEFPVPVYEIVDVDHPTEIQLKMRKKWFRQ